MAVTQRDLLKGAVVEWVEHPQTKRRAAIRLFKPTMTFFATEREDEALLIRSSVRRMGARCGRGSSSSWRARRSKTA